jgi:hypothetical protein
MGPWAFGSMYACMHAHLLAAWLPRFSLLRMADCVQDAPGTGITNGAAWYSIFGGMQDWNYIMGKCMELTVELSMQKYPLGGAQLTKLWQDNSASLLKWAEMTAFGGWVAPAGLPACLIGACWVGWRPACAWEAMWRATCAGVQQHSSHPPG